MSTAGGSRFQGGPACEIFSPQGTDPVRKQGVGVHGRVRREFDKSIKGYALVCEGGGTTCKVEFPGAKAQRKNLGLTQRFLALQVCLPAAADPFGLELTVADAQRTRRRLVISSAFRGVVAHPLHAQLPLCAAFERHFGHDETADERDVTVVPRGLWLTLCLDMQELVASNFSGINFRALEALAICGTCKVRRVFTLKDPPPAANVAVASDRSLKPIPRQFHFLGTMDTSPPTVCYSMDAVLAWERVHGVEQHLSPRHHHHHPHKPVRSRRLGDKPPTSARSTSTLGVASVSSATPRTRRVLQAKRQTTGSTPPETHDLDPYHDGRLDGDFASHDAHEPHSDQELSPRSRDEGEIRKHSGVKGVKREGLLPALAKAKGTAPPKFTLDLPIQEERPSARRGGSGRSRAAPASSQRSTLSKDANHETHARHSNQEREDRDVAPLNEYAANSPLSPVPMRAHESDRDSERGEKDDFDGEQARGEADLAEDGAALTDDEAAYREEEQDDDDADIGEVSNQHRDSGSDQGGDLLSENDEILLDGADEISDVENDLVGNDVDDDNDDELELSAAIEANEASSDLRSRLEQEREELARMDARLAKEEDELLRKRDRSSNQEKTTRAEPLPDDDLNALSEQVLQTTIADALHNLSRVETTDGENVEAGGEEQGDEEPGSGDLDLVFDPILECYFCPKTNKYYKMK